jgi:hypothetical protein
MFDERTEVREPAESQTAVFEIRGRKHMVRLANVSPSGAMVIFALMPNIGEKVALHLLSRGRVEGQVCWVRDGRVGVNFVGSEE